MNEHSGLEEIYKAMKEIRGKYYETGVEAMTMDIALFFRLFKLVCDMRQIERIVEDQ